MSETIIICLYIVFGISAVLGLIKELKKPEKNQFLILFDSLILIAAIFLVASIFI
ncbi:putative membrane protein [Bacillus clarus]|uniref:Putative membrane protein n=1 Tax=Bacillus clarus TaxID=2338372 RepID=A0A090YN03_9BACI|nr:putative membrane protein [Bacillus clarus]